MCPYLDTWVMSQNAMAALKYMSGVGAEPRPPRLGPSSDANVMWPSPARLTVASFKNGVTDVTSASKTISRRVIVGSSPPGTLVIPARSIPRRSGDDLHSKAAPVPLGRRREDARPPGADPPRTDEERDGVHDVVARDRAPPERPPHALGIERGDERLQDLEALALTRGRLLRVLEPARAPGQHGEDDLGVGFAHAGLEGRGHEPVGLGDLRQDVPQLDRDPATGRVVIPRAGLGVRARAERRARRRRKDAGGARRAEEAPRLHVRGAGRQYQADGDVEGDHRPPPGGPAEGAPHVGGDLEAERAEPGAARRGPPAAPAAA